MARVNDREETERVVKRYWQFVAAAGLGIAVGTTPVRADLFSSVVLGLDAAGFQVTGAPNPLSGGFNAQIDRTFVGETLDFGAAELSLLGPISMSYGYGGRLIDTFDLSFSTLGQPFQYLYSADTGGQETFISGSFALDGSLSVNSFGFYDLNMFLSSRQDIDTEGRFSNVDGQEQDFDLGPVNVSGNIFADLLAVLFDPIFDATGAQNIFTSFSTRGGLDESLFNVLQRGAAGSSAAAAIGGGRLSPDLAFLATDSFPAAGLGTSGGAAPVPEPATVLLCLGGVAAITACQRRRHRRELAAPPRQRRP